MSKLANGIVHIHHVGGWTWYTAYNQPVGADRHRVLIRNPSKNVFQGNAEMAEGTIKKVMDKGFGFIKTATDKDLFFHSSAVQGVSFNDLREGQKVTYTEGMGQKGPCAENVKPA